MSESFYYDYDYDFGYVMVTKHYVSETLAFTLRYDYVTRNS